MQRGAHAANGFTLRLTGLRAERALLDARLERIAADGVPNYFGLQRFGHGGGNLVDARSCAEQDLLPANRNLRSRFLSAGRSYLFNRLLAERVAEGSWNRAAVGDLLAFTDSRSFFLAGEEECRDARLAALDLHPTGPLGDWAVYNQVAGGTGQAARLLPVGMKRPNPLGLFDVIGNAAEMVQESFQLVHAGRRQGTYGGFVVKGGNYLEGEMTLFTGMRREYPLFAADGSEQRNETTGFRVAIGALSAPRSRYPELFAQWQKEGRLAALTDAIDDAQDPTKQLDGIIAATRDPQMQAQLAQINEELKRNVSLIARQREEAAGNLIQSAALVAETINNYNIRLTNLKKDREKAVAARDQATAQLYAGAIANGRSALDGALAIYIDNLATGTRYTDAVIQAQFQRIQEELNRNPVLGKSLVKRATLFVKHVGDYRQQHRAEPEAVLKELLASSGR